VSNTFGQFFKGGKDMIYYEVKKKFLDYINGYEFLRGEFIQTDEESWAHRMGDSLSEVRNLPPNVKAKLVKGTVEQKALDATKIKEKIPGIESDTEELPKVRTRVQTRAPMDKVVRARESVQK